MLDGSLDTNSPYVQTFVAARLPIYPLKNQMKVMHLERESERRLVEARIEEAAETSERNNKRAAANQKSEEADRSTKRSRWGPSRNQAMGETPRVLAASSATEAELEAAKSFKDSSKPVEPSKRPFRPKVPSEYIEEELIPDELETMEVMFQDFGKSVLKDVKELPPRDDILLWDKDNPKHQAEFDKNIQWADCPEEHRDTIADIIKENWDAFAEEGIQKPIHGFAFNVDTGAAKPVCCKTPRYGPHEAQIIIRLTDEMLKNGLTEPDHGSPWGSLVVLAAKPHQSHKHWLEYTWRLCVSFRPLNKITRPFKFCTRRCDDAAQDIGSANFTIAMDFFWGYWQVKCVKEARSKLAFFIPNGKQQWKRMPMGALNSHAVYCSIVEILKKEWDEEAYHQGIDVDDISMSVPMRDITKRTGSQNIVDGVILYSMILQILLLYFRIMLTKLIKYRFTISLKKCRFLPSEAEFVGYDVCKEGNRPAASKIKTMDNLRLKKPEDVGSLRLLIGFLGFYQHYLPLYEIRISGWREYQKKCPSGSLQEERKYFATVWTDADETLRLALLDELKSRPPLARPDFNRRFYLKTDWCSLGKAAVLLQADPNDPDARLAEEAEDGGEICMFDNTIKDLKFRLVPILFISERNTEAERSWHSRTGEVYTGLWAFNKFKRWLFGRTFTWMTDCSGSLTFFETKDLPSHAHQRWRMQMNTYQFTMVHRPERMMKEVDILSRYNMWTKEWRKAGRQPDDELSQATPKPLSALYAPVPSRKETTATMVQALMARVQHRAGAHVMPKEVGPENAPKTELALASSRNRRIWVLQAISTPIVAACQLAGVIPLVTAEIDDRMDASSAQDKSRRPVASLTTNGMLQRLNHSREQVEWIVHAHGGKLRGEGWSSDKEESFRRLVRKAADDHGLQALVVIERLADDLRQETMDSMTWIKEDLGWSSVTTALSDTQLGAAIQGTHRVTIATRTEEFVDNLVFPDAPARPMAEALDSNLQGVDDAIATYELSGEVTIPEVHEVANHRPQTTGRFKLPIGEGKEDW